MLAVSRHFVFILTACRICIARDTEFHIGCDISELKTLFTFFLADLKKTLAVLLDNIMLRLGKLEAKVENIYNGTGGNLTNGTSTATPSATNSEKVNVAGMYPFFFFFALARVLSQKICLFLDFPKSLSPEKPSYSVYGSPLEAHN